MSVPALRFTEFTESWDKFSLKEIAQKIQDGTHFSPEVSESGDYKYLTSKNVKNGYIDLSNLTYISEKAHKEIYKRCDVRKGDVLLTKDGTIGQVCVNTLSEPFSLLSSVAFIRTKDMFSNYFLYHLLLSPNGQEEINKSIAGQALKRITLTKINSYIYSFPSFEEQTKIANFLTAVDEKISLLTHKHDLLNQYKKGLMHKIFSQELRFKDDDGRDFPEWEEKLLGSVAEITTGSSNRVDSTAKDGTYTFFDRSQDIRTSDIYLFDCEAVIVAGEGQEFIPKHFIGKFDLHQRTYAIMSFNNFDGKYLFYYVYQHRGYFLSQAVGSTVKSLRLPMFQKMPVQMPSLKEQTRIANFLTAIDDKITATHTQLQAVKQYKHGLLQQMFV